MNNMTAYEMLSGFINYFMYNTTDFSKEDIASALSELSGEFNADMSWDELVEKAKELGYEYDKDDYGFGHTLHKKMNTEIRSIYATGNVVIEDINGVGFIFKEGRTPAQMYQIMLALD